MMSVAQPLLASLDISTLATYPEAIAAVVGTALTLWMGLGLMRLRGWMVPVAEPCVAEAPRRFGEIATATRNLLADLEDVGGRECPAYIRREVWQWVQQAEVATVGCGSELHGPLAAIRRHLAQTDQASAIRAVIGLLRVFDQRLCTPRGDHYRGLAGRRGRGQQGDSRGFEDIAERKQVYEQILASHGPGMRRVAASYTRTASERDDLFQDIGLALWRALASYRGEASLRTFAYRVAHNRAVTHSTRRKPTPENIESSRVCCDAPSPEQSLDRAEQRRRLQAAVLQLPVGQRQVLTLALEGFRHAEIAEVVGISEKNVSVRLSRARRRLANQLRGQQ